MKSTIVVGLQWGDEGKGKIIDAIAKNFSSVVRWNGGNNAGHTVEVSGKRYPLSLIPSGVFQRKKLFIAQGAVINPEVLLNELRMLKKNGYTPRLTIDPRCHIVMPYHSELDAANEFWKGKHATGSLHLGIGYCYEDRNNRHGIRLEDLVKPAIFKERLTRFFPLKKAFIEKSYGMKSTLKLNEIYKRFLQYGRKLKPYMGDVSQELSRVMMKESVLFEQAHGTMLDPVFGTYPYTVAPPTLASAVYTSVGIPVSPLPVLGIAKAYTTRVGNGPLPTEQKNRIGEHLQTNGHEVGTVSGRKRRCGWLDAVQLRYAMHLNGVSHLALTKLDVLSGLETLHVCIGYKLDSNRLSQYPALSSDVERIKPIYKTLKGWNKSLQGIKRFSDLPKEAKAYIRFIEQQLATRVQYISVGPDRNALIRV